MPAEGPRPPSPRRSDGRRSRPRRPRSARGAFPWRAPRDAQRRGGRSGPGCGARARSADRRGEAPRRFAGALPRAGPGPPPRPSDRLAGPSASGSPAPAARPSRSALFDRSFAAILPPRIDDLPLTAVNFPNAAPGADAPAKFQSRLRAVKFKTLGRTGVQVSQLCSGTIAFGGDADEGASGAMFKAGRHPRINFFDTADQYSKGRSEQILGRLMRGSRDDLVVATNCFNPSGSDINAKGGSPRHIILA